MTRTYMLLQVFGSFLLLLFFAPDGRAQSKSARCNSAVIALNITPVMAADAKAGKKPCNGEQGKRINQPPGAAAGQGIPYYNDVPFDQLGKPFINSFPEVSAPGRPGKKICSAAGTDKSQKIIACSKSGKEKECSPKKEEPKRLRPSAAVKLVKLD